MATIGFVQQQDDGSFAGTLTTLALKAKIRIVPVGRKTSDNGPDYRVITSDGVDIGAAWIRTGRESQRDYVSLKIDDPPCRRRSTPTSAVPPVRTTTASML